ncbi:MAG: hypothetical protein H6970_02715 [Gammaproteobacteria bacterium]|nr:hypothetical protein [Gammaproteobacteria bacterium]MCP5423971.1 hypothetical protein [Gammaproteobacteria bacterium]MCP5459450.1 hypothetical protein [Gammaproteobacteria bacterium]
MISPEQLDQVADFVTTEGLNESVVARLRTQYPGTHFTYCLDDDIVDADPVKEYPGFNMYLVNGHMHCVRLTDDPEHATGIVLAEILDDL